MQVFDGAAGEAPAFAALDVPTHVTLRRAVADLQVSGWVMTLVGVAGLAVFLATGDRYEVLTALVTAAVVGVLSWLIAFRRALDKALAAPRPAGDAAAFESGPSRNTCAAVAIFALVAAITTAIGLTPPAAVALGVGGPQLLAVARMRSWERRNGRTLYVAKAWRNKLYAR